MNLKSAVAVLLSCAVPGAATVKAVPVRVAVPTAGVPLAPVVLPAVRGGSFSNALPLPAPVLPGLSSLTSALPAPAVIPLQAATPVGAPAAVPQAAQAQAAAFAAPAPTARSAPLAADGAEGRSLPSFKESSSRVEALRDAVGGLGSASAASAHGLGAELEAALTGGAARSAHPADLRPGARPFDVFAARRPGLTALSGAARPAAASVPAPRAALPVLFDPLRGSLAGGLFAGTAALTLQALYGWQPTLATALAGVAAAAGVGFFGGARPSASAAAWSAGFAGGLLAPAFGLAGAAAALAAGALSRRPAVLGGGAGVLAGVLIAMASETGAVFLRLSPLAPGMTLAFAALLVPLALLIGAASTEAGRPANGVVERRAAADWQRATALEKHAAFFDRDGDGVVRPGETYAALRALGFGRLKSALVAAGIHAGLGARVRLDAVHLGKHGSDTGVYDATGRFVPEAFERLFARFDPGASGALGESDIARMISAHTKERPGAAFAAKVEFRLLLDAAADRVKGGERAISRARLASFYEGSLFYELAGEVPPWRT